jgi:competence protein ComEC
VYLLGRLKLKHNKIYVKADKPFIKEEKSKAFELINKIRNFLINSFKEKTLNQQSFAIGNALIFGDRSYINKETKNAYLQTGLIHLLAISGFHIAIIFSIIMIIFSPISKKLAYYLAIIFLMVFVFISGFKIPVIRASIGGIFYAISKIKGYKTNFLNLLFFIAFISVLVEPYTIFSVSFQLSFLAVLGIFLIWQKLNLDLKSKFWEFIIKSYITSVVASLFILPVLLYHFGKFSLVSVLFTTPLIVILYPYIFLEVINLITLFKLDILINAMDYIGIAFSNIVNLLSGLGMNITNHYISTKFLILYYAVLFTIYTVNLKPAYFILINILLFVFITAV